MLVAGVRAGKMLGKAKQLEPTAGCCGVCCREVCMGLCAPYVCCGPCCPCCQTKAQSAFDRSAEKFGLDLGADEAAAFAKSGSFRALGDTMGRLLEQGGGAFFGGAAAGVADISCFGLLHHNRERVDNPAVEELLSGSERLRAWYARCEREAGRVDHLADLRFVKPAGLVQ